MILGIDFGSTTTDFVLFSNGKLMKSFSFPKISNKSIESKISCPDLNFPLSKIKKIAVTGGHSSKISSSLLGIPVAHVSEIDAIGFGGAVLSNLKKCAVVSMGTGTCIVFHNGRKNLHIGGTGIGGGTLTGLSSLLIETQVPEKINSLACKGNPEKINLLVREAIGSGIGIVPGNATASNFAKISSRKKQDLAAATARLVSESVAVASVFAASSVSQKRIVFIGKTPLLSFVRKELKRVAGYYGVELLFPKNFGFGSAVGAAAFASRNS